MICDCKIKMGSKRKTREGDICSLCASISPSYQTDGVERLKGYWDENHRRWLEFVADQELKSFVSDTITIDHAHKMFYVGSKKLKSKQFKMNCEEPTVYKFSEIKRYEREHIAGKMETKKKGGITRAVVGGAVAGPVGALVGSGTAKTHMKEVGGTDIFRLFLSYQSIETTRVLRPSNEAIAFFDKCIDDSATNNKKTTSEADELMKYKNLLDIGAITQEEYEMKKKELLNL